MEKEVKINPESIVTNFRVEKFTYWTPDEAESIYKLLPDSDKYQMADVYKEAFGGSPWYERFKCVGCKEFTATDDICSNCEKTIFEEAYPTQQLVQEYFPKMLSKFTPGVLLTAKTGAETLGFCTGGFTTPKELIVKKYRGNTQILRSILLRSGLNPNDPMFYDNETCIRSDKQKKGVGGKLSQVRVDIATELGAGVICGRTINLPWLSLKENQLREGGYDFLSFVPEGDRYEVNGVGRYFFIARKI